MTDEIRERLARIDPMPSGVPTASVMSESSRELLEGIMSLPTIEQEKPARPSKTNWLVGVAAVAAVVMMIGGVAALTGDDAGSVVANAPALELTAGGGDTMASCIAFSVETLATMEVAFEGTVTSVDGDVVTLDVDHWFKGGDATRVNLNAPQGLEALIAGIPFEIGGQYLITAFDGNVNYCGFSGPSTPEYRAAFQEAFGS